MRAIYFADMFFPIGDDQVHGGHKPYVSYSVIVVCVLAYVWQLSDPSGLLYVLEYGTVPVEVAHGVDLHTLFTSMFMHGGFMHLLGNMLFLWVFADNIEAVVGSTRFMVFYLLGGLVASAAQVLLDVQSAIPCVGASGAIAAVMGAYLVMYPRSRIKMLFVFTLGTFHLPALAFLGIWIAQQLFTSSRRAEPMAVVWPTGRTSVALPPVSRPGSFSGPRRCVLRNGPMRSPRYGAATSEMVPGSL